MVDGVAELGYATAAVLPVSGPDHKSRVVGGDGEDTDLADVAANVVANDPILIEPIGTGPHLGTNKPEGPLTGALARPGCQGNPADFSWQRPMLSGVGIPHHRSVLARCPYHPLPSPRRQIPLESGK